MIGGVFSTGAPRRGALGDEAMLPLVNVVLLLLVFFMVAGSLRPPEAFPLDPARAEGEAVGSAGPLRVSLSADGRVALGGRSLTRDALMAQVTPGAAVLLRADAGAAASAALGLARGLQEAGAGRVDLLVLAP
jgi:biopolymer transport protein ExbD